MRTRLRRTASVASSGAAAIPRSDIKTHISPSFTRLASNPELLLHVRRSCLQGGLSSNSNSNSNSNAQSLGVKPPTVQAPRLPVAVPLSSRHRRPYSMAPATVSSGADKALNVQTINQHLVAAKYAVRGELPSRSEKYRQQIKDNGQGSLPFDNVISANIGNPQQLDQKPLTFFRQVLSLLEYPALLDHPDVLTKSLGYKEDAVERARWLLGEVGSVGAYSQSQGTPGIRKSVAKFIERRDGHPADWESIFLTNGASSGVNTLMSVICASPETGVLIPIPQYPLYTATLALLNARPVEYYLDESQDWSLNIDEIRSALDRARQEGTDVKAIVIINPGNPTGASLPAEDIRAVLELAAEERLVVLGDEVYQTNVFKGTFFSFKKCLRDLQAEQPGKYDSLELASLHSISKGMVGECGHRGGFMELIGFDPDVVAQMYKFISIQLCPPVIGQCAVELMVNPPQPGDASYEQYREEYDGIFQGLRKRASALHRAFVEMEGVKCPDPQGAMYLFPTISLPQKAADAAKDDGRSPDEFYCSKLLDATGICVVPGSGFGQKEGTLHFRTTFLAPGTDWVSRITEFHKKFMDEYR